VHQRATGDPARVQATRTRRQINAQRGQLRQAPLDLTQAFSIPPTLPTVWHCEHLVLKSLAPAATSAAFPRISGMVRVGEVGGCGERELEEGEKKGKVAARQAARNNTTSRQGGAGQESAQNPTQRPRSSLAKRAKSSTTATTCSVVTAVRRARTRVEFQSLRSLVSQKNWEVLSLIEQ
jgi:hypothetical protein